MSIDDVGEAHSTTWPKKRVIAAGVLVIVCVAVFVVGFINRPSDSVLSRVRTQRDFENLSTKERRNFCTEVLHAGAESAEVAAVHKRLGLSGDLTENVFLGCAVSMGGDEYVSRDISGANEKAYRKTAAEDRAVADTFTFDTYDVTYTADDVGLSKRVASAIQGEAKNLYLTYATLKGGGFNPYSSNEVINVKVFDVREFAGLTNHCGPSLMHISYTDQYNQVLCNETSATFLDP